MILLGLLIACGSPPAEPEPSASTGPVGPVTLVYSGRGEGEIEPCG